jgi:Bacterial dnaA protein helix-turn-helix
MVTNNDINGWVSTPFGEGDLRMIIPSDISKSCEIAVVQIYCWTIAGNMLFIPTSDVLKVNKFVENKKLTMCDINQIVSDFLEISKEDIQLNIRKREIVEARQVCMFFSKYLTKNSLSAIGNMFGRKDHATVLHAEKTILNRIETEHNFKNIIKEIHNKLAPGKPFDFDKKK